MGNIYAAGDVIRFPALAPTSMEQGHVGICDAFGFPYKQRLTSQLPMGIYTIPEISAVGETEECCREKKIEYEVGRAKYANNARGQIIGDFPGILKLIFRRDNKELLGVQILEESATELIHVGMAVLEAGGTIDTFIELVFNYPTLSEIYRYAAYDGLGNLAGHTPRGIEGHYPSNVSIIYATFELGWTRSSLLLSACRIPLEFAVVLVPDRIILCQFQGSRCPTPSTDHHLPGA